MADNIWHLQATSRMLATSTAAEREATLRFADAAQWEYEDEYDDSYDDLAPFGNDAAADVEGQPQYAPCLINRVCAVLLLVQL